MQWATDDAFESLHVPLVGDAKSDSRGRDFQHGVELEARPVIEFNPPEVLLGQLESCEGLVAEELRNVLGGESQEVERGRDPSRRVDVVTQPHGCQDGNQREERPIEPPYSHGELDLCETVRCLVCCRQA